MDEKKEKKLYNLWTDEEIRYLKDNWGTLGGRTAEMLKNHTPPAVRQKAKELGLKRTAGKNRWSVEEKEFLKANYRPMGMIKTAKALKRDPSVVYAQAEYMGLTGKRKEIVHD